MKKAMAYDAAEFLETDEDVAAYLRTALDDGDPALVAAPISDAVRARGMAQLANDAVITRDDLSLSAVKKIV